MELRLPYFSREMKPCLLAVMFAKPVLHEPEDLSCNQYRNHQHDGRKTESLVGKRHHKSKVCSTRLDEICFNLFKPILNFNVFPEDLIDGFSQGHLGIQLTVDKINAFARVVPLRHHIHFKLGGFY